MRKSQKVCFFFSAYLQDKADSQRDDRFCFCCCNILWDRAVALTIPVDRNDLQDMSHLTPLRPPVWVSESQRCSNSHHYTGLKEPLFQ